MILPLGITFLQINNAKNSITSDDLGRGRGLEFHFSSQSATLRIVYNPAPIDIKYFYKLGHN